MDQLAVTMRTTKRASNADVKNADGLSADVPVEEIPTVGKFVEAPLLRTLSSPSNQSSAQKASKVACMNALDTINRTCGNPVFHTRGYTSMRLRVLEVKEAGVLVPQTLLWICVDSTLAKQTISSSQLPSSPLEFELAETTQFVKFCFWSKSGDKVLGLSSIEMDAIFRADGAPIQLMLYAVNSSDFTSYTALVRVDFFRRSPAPLPKDTKLEDPTVEATVGSDGVRSLVSKKKRRWKRDGFDLDLTYVTERIIAMGFPSEALEGTYRNHMKDVQRFFLRRHSQNFKIYNLCSERAYDPAKFDNRVSHYPFDDHNPCPISTFVACCEDMRLASLLTLRAAWLSTARRARGAQAPSFLHFWCT